LSILPYIRRYFYKIFLSGLYDFFIRENIFPIVQLFSRNIKQTSFPKQPKFAAKIICHYLVCDNHRFFSWQFQMPPACKNIQIIVPAIGFADCFRPKAPREKIKFRRRKTGTKKGRLSPAHAP